MRSRPESILVYTENVHDTYTLTVLQLLNMEPCRIFLMTPREKFDRLTATMPELMRPIKYVPLRARLLIKRRFIARIFSSLNGLGNFREFRRVLSKNKIPQVLFLEAYNDAFNFLLTRQRSRLSNVKLILTVHNIDQYVKDYAKFRDLFRKYGCKRPGLINVRLFNEADCRVVLTEKMRHQLAQFTGKDSICVPFSLTDDQDIERRALFLSKSAELDRPRFVVPGVVSEKRKMYKTIIDAFSGFEPESYDLVFLGPVYEKSIIDYAQSRKVSVTSYTSYISMDEFSRCMSTAHFLVAIVPDILPYGLFKASGVEFDGPKHGVPVITNDGRLISDQGHYLVIQDLEGRLKELLAEFRAGAWSARHGIPAFKKMKENTASKYGSILRKLAAEAGFAVES